MDTKSSGNSFSKYIKESGLRPVFYLSPLVIILMIINLVYLPGGWRWIGFAILAVVLFLLIFLGVSLARNNIISRVRSAQMESIINHLSVGVLAYDSDFSLLVFNPAAEEIFGISANEVVGKKLSADMAGGADMKVLIQVVFPSLAPMIVRKSDPGVYPQVADISFDDPRLDLRVTTDRIFDEDGGVIGFVKLITNRTREAELLQAKTEFIAIAAHQLRTPLTAVNWSLEALERESLNASQKELVDTGFSAAKKMLKTVNDLLDVSKIEEGRFGYNFEEVGVTAYLEDILLQVQDLAKQFGVKVYFKRPEEDFKVFIDPQRVSMALFNILDNAIKYNVENGEVSLFIDKTSDGKFAQISIKDTGVGISQEDTGKIFSKFFRAEGVIKHSPDGTGLGLYITKNIIKRHGGSVWFESEVNRGSTFYLTLPLSKDILPKREATEFE